MCKVNWRKSLAAVAAVVVLVGGWIGAAAERVKFALVKKEVIEARLGKYAKKNQEREATLKQLFSDAGCGGDYLSEQKVRESKLPNVVCKLPGSSDRVIIVGAHFDHVADGDGVVDNWSGASLLPSLYEAIKDVPREHAFVFIGFTDEEKGEIGSRFYAQQMTKEQVAATDAMVNMDTLGLALTEVWNSHSDKLLVHALAYIAGQLKSPISGADVDKIGSSDSVQFSERKIPSITIHSLTQQTWDARILHTSKDKLSEIRMDDYYQTYRLVAAYLAYLDQLPGTPAAKGH
jgi:putative aminopeptidase FrvX